jgi:cell division protein FtsB
MVTRRRFRRFMIPLALYAFSATVSGYFAYQANHGQRGLQAKREYKIRIAGLKQEIETLQGERASWERRIALLKVDRMDRDLLDERARVILNGAHKNDVVVIVSP